MTVGETYIFSSMPKTGNTWCDHVLVKYANGTKHKEYAHCFSDPDDSTKNHRIRKAFPRLPPDMCSNRRIIVSVRDPLAYYRSYWKFRVKGGWRMVWPMDRFIFSKYRAMYNGAVVHVKPMPFYDFLDAILEEGTPFLSEMCELYTRNADMVCRLEHLNEDVVGALKKCGEPGCDYASIFGTDPRFVTDTLEVGGWDACEHDGFDEYLKRETLLVMKHGVDVTEDMKEDLYTLERFALEVWRNAGIQ